MSWESFARSISLFVIGIVFLGVPVAASTAAAVYGSTSGFLPDMHTNDITVVYTIPGHSSGLFDKSVDSFTDPSTDVIFIGNDDDFSSATAAAIEQAVWNGKVLVISYPATSKFGDSLPVTSAGTIEGNSTLVVTSLTHGIARTVFSGLNKTFTATEPVGEQLTGTLKTGSIPLLSFTTGEPALVYRQYGSGYVVEWMVATPALYLGSQDADTVNFRVVEALVAAVHGSAAPVTTAATTSVPTTTATPAPTVKETSSTSNTGTALIQSSPLGARIYIDGIYQGKTPLKLQDMPTGYHSVKMTLDGYYDFDGSAYIVEDETITVFGSLQAAPAATTPTTQATPVLTTEVPTTPAAAATSSPSDPLSNPTVIAAGIGIITAGIGAYATIYTHKEKKE